MDYPKWKEQMESEGYIVNGLSLTKKEDNIITEEVKEVEIIEPIKIEDLKETKIIEEIVDKTEETIEIEGTEEVIEKTDEVTKKIDYDSMTKKEFELFARENYNLELDRRETKDNMIKFFEDRIKLYKIEL